MRHLSVKQKRLLKERWQEIRDEGKEYPSIEDIGWSKYDEIYDIHPCEIHYQNVQHFFDDLNDEAMLQSPAFTVYHIENGKITKTQEW